jgi:hypothetical protein
VPIIKGGNNNLSGYERFGDSNIVSRTNSDRFYSINTELGKTTTEKFAKKN